MSFCCVVQEPVGGVSVCWVVQDGRGVFEVVYDT